MAEVTATAPAPVMDVVAPPAEKKADTPNAADPVDQLAAADHKSQQASSQDHAEKSAQKAQPTKRAESTRHGVGLAIAATVIIILGLAALATYAYLQTNT
jgi:hypothetical protein